MSLNYIQFKPLDFLKMILEKIEQEEELPTLPEFLAYTEKYDIWKNDSYDTIFYSLYDYIDERIPLRVYSLEDLKQDIHDFIKKSSQ